MTYRQRADVKTRQVSDEMLVLDEQNGFVHQLNPTASFIWQACDGTSSAAEIAQRLSAEFAIDLETATGDVAGTIDQLRELNLIVN